MLMTIYDNGNDSFDIYDTYVGNNLWRCQLIMKVTMLIFMILATMTINDTDSIDRPPWPQEAHHCRLGSCPSLSEQRRYIYHYKYWAASLMNKGKIMTSQHILTSRIPMMFLWIYWLLEEGVEGDDDYTKAKSPCMRTT